MKTPHTPTPLGCFFLGLSLLLGLSPATARADITGQWNFTEGLSAEIGQDLEWNFDQGEAQFGKGSAFRLKPLDGKDPMVMSFPNSDPTPTSPGWMFITVVNPTAAPTGY